MSRKSQYEPMELEVEAALPAMEALPGAERGLFHLKPAAWYVLLEGWMTWLALIAVVTATVAASMFTDWINPTARGTVCQFAMALLLVRLVYDSFRWAGVAFLLTDRRAVVQRGIAQAEISQVALEDVDEIELVRSPVQRLTRTGTLVFRIEGIRPPVLMWEHISDPADIRESILAAVGRAKRARVR